MVIKPTTALLPVVATCQKRRTAFLPLRRSHGDTGFNRKIRRMQHERMFDKRLKVCAVPTIAWIENASTDMIATTATTATTIAPAFPLESTVTSSLLASSSLMSSSSSSTSSSSITVPPTFEPVLNVPALTVFLFIMSIFVLLQWRIRAIDNAAVQRNVALRQLRNLKALELSDPTLSTRWSATSGSSSTNNSSDASTTTISTVQTALEEYRVAYNRMEELRTILPGIRIVSPPSSNINRQQELDHEIAAQQFLGIIPWKENETENSKNAVSISNENKRSEEERPSPSSLFPSSSAAVIRNTILVLVAISQIALFVFLIGTDPMM